MKKCLIVVDYQNDFVTGSLGFIEAKSIEHQIAEKIKKYHKNNDTVIFTIDTHYDNYLDTQEGKNLPVIHCINNSMGQRLYGEVSDASKSDDIFIKKSSFGSDKLYNLLKEEQYNEVLLVGIISNICVLANAVLAKTALPESTVTVDKSCVVSNDSRMNKYAFKIMKGLQINVIGDDSEQ